MIYDCFTFFNELDLLEIRLNILSPVVDKFVLVEADKTHTGETKPLIFTENKARFAAFAERIIHVPLHNLPALQAQENDNRGDNWRIENAQRDAILQGLNACAMDDIVIIADLDEIPAPETVQNYRDTQAQGIWMLQQAQMYYFLNNLCLTEPVWEKVRMGRYRDLLFPGQTLAPSPYYAFSQEGTPNYFRFCNGQRIKNGGWHFSYCGGVESILKKARAISEQTVRAGQTISPEMVSSRIQQGLDIYGRRGLRYGPVRIDATFPDYLRREQAKYPHLIVPVNGWASRRSHFMRFAYATRKRLIKIVCSLIPVRSWRKRVRALA